MSVPLATFFDLPYEIIYKIFNQLTNYELQQFSCMLPYSLRIIAYERMYLNKIVISENYDYEKYDWLLSEDMTIEDLRIKLRDDAFKSIHPELMQIYSFKHRDDYSTIFLPGNKYHQFLNECNYFHCIKSIIINAEGVREDIMESPTCCSEYDMQSPNFFLDSTSITSTLFKTNLVSLKVSHCDIENYLIYLDDPFCKFKSLKHLDFYLCRSKSFDQIDILGKYYFPSTVETLRLESCQISIISSIFIRKLPIGLKSLILRGNCMKEFNIPGLNKLLPNLEYLDLSHCLSICRVEPLCFTRTNHKFTLKIEDYTLDSDSLDTQAQIMGFDVII